MAMYLKITDGTTTFDLLGGSATNGFNLEANKWAPNVAERLPNGKVSEVIEEIPLYVSSTSSPATVLANIDKLAKLIDQAARWAKGESLSPVRIQYSPNSATEYLEAAILGPPDGAGGVALPPNFSDDLYQNVVDGIVLKFRRHGRWLDDDEDVSTSSTVNNCELMSLSLTATQNPSPTILRLGKFNYSTGPNQTFGGFLLLAEDTNNLQIINVESAALGNTTSVNDSSNLARNTNVLRYTPVQAYPLSNDGTSNISLSLNASTKLLGVFANMRNNSATAEFTVWPRVQRLMKGTEAFDQKTAVPAGATTPQWYFLGMHSLASGLQVLNLKMYVDDVTGSPTLDIDTLVVVNMEKVHVIALHETSIQNWTTTDTEINCDHSLLSTPLPRVYASTAGIAAAGVGHDGYPAFFTSAANLQALYLSTGGNSSAHWRRSNDSGSVMQLYAEVARRPAFLVPQ